MLVAGFGRNGYNSYRLGILSINDNRTEIPPTVLIEPCQIQAVKKIVVTASASLILCENGQFWRTGESAANELLRDISVETCSPYTTFTEIHQEHASVEQWNLEDVMCQLLHLEYIVDMAATDHCTILLTQSGKLFYNQQVAFSERKDVALLNVAKAAHICAVDSGGMFIMRDSANTMFYYMPGTGDPQKITYDETLAKPYEVEEAVCSRTEHYYLLTKCGTVFQGVQSRAARIKAFDSVKIKKIVCGRSHTIFMGSEVNQIYGVGLGDDGQLGQDMKGDHSAPVLINLPSYIQRVTDVFAGPFCTFLFADKHVYVGGYYGGSSLKYRKFTLFYALDKFIGKSKLKQISCSYMHSLILVESIDRRSLLLKSPYHDIEFCWASD